MKHGFIIVATLLLVTTTALAKQKLNTQPVHLDNSGMPTVNSWERNEDLRQIRNNQEVQNKGNNTIDCDSNNSVSPCPNTVKVVTPKQVQPVPIQNKAGTPQVVQSPSTETTKNVVVKTDATEIDVTTVVTPTSVLVNRPVGTTGDPKSKDFSF